MKSICLYLQIHMPFRFRRYHFFDIGSEHYYYDDYSNETSLVNAAAKSYLPLNKLLLKLAGKYNSRFKVAFSISGTALDQFKLYAPEVIQSFRDLAQAGCAEFLSETYSHSLASLINNDVFQQQVKLHEQRISDLFGQNPKIFRNTNMIYSDDIGDQVYKMGYKAMITSGLKQLPAWKSPNYLYVNARNPRLKVLFTNHKLSSDISLCFSDTTWPEYPLTAGKYTHWLENLDFKEEIVNIFLSYETFGQQHPKSSGIFEFLEHWIGNVVKNDKLQFIFPSQAIQEMQPISVVSVPDPVSGTDDNGNLSFWPGNEMQKEAINKLYVLSHQMIHCQNIELLKDWNYLQDSNHFYTLSALQQKNRHKQSYFNPFDSPYEAFINYMNILSDFTLRVNDEIPIRDNEIKNNTALMEMILEKEIMIRKLESELQKLKKHKAGPDNKIKKNKRE